jgi:Tfp pilus assembly protein PilV
MSAKARAEDGMTLIEVMVAALVLVVGVLALLSTLTSTQALNSKSERESQAVDYAQMQVEQLRALPYASLALSSCTPGNATWTSLAAGTNPNLTPLATESEVSPCTGKVAPVSTWQDDKLSTRGSVYRYVTQASANVKRIVVAVTVTGGAGTFSKPVAVTTLVPDPNAGQSNGSVMIGPGNPCLLSAVGLGLICLS